ncbi:cytochrome P450 [Spirillospora sp. CA-294931]|uniref:cytochrome P450 n=1 Tax=Spirillospora sp. CA-294931 TaxID=3240042 RepID=UPI003D8F6755
MPKRRNCAPEARPRWSTSWAISDPGLLKRLLTDERVSKDAHRHWPLFPDEIVGKWPPDLWVGVRNMMTAYGADHRRLRRLVSPALTARRVAALVPRIERVTRALLDDLAACPPGQAVDLRERFAYPIPIQMISDLVGVPDRARPGFDAVFDTTLTAEQQTANAHETYAILRDLVAAKRAEPADDMTSVLIATRDENGAALTEQELLDTLLLVIGAGHETTVNLLDQAIAALLTHPDQLDRVRAGWDDVIEEALRYEAPVSHVPLRYAVEDIAVPAGPTIRRGHPGLLRRRRAPPGPARRHGRPVRRHPSRQGTSRLRPRGPLLPGRPARAGRGDRRPSRPVRALPGSPARRPARRPRTQRRIHLQRSPRAARPPGLGSRMDRAVHRAIV